MGVCSGYPGLTDEGECLASHGVGCRSLNSCEHCAIHVTCSFPSSPHLDVSHTWAVIPALFHLSIWISSTVLLLPDLFPKFFLTPPAYLEVNPMLPGIWKESEGLMEKQRNKGPWENDLTKDGNGDLLDLAVQPGNHWTSHPIAVSCWLPE